jgi:thiol-disulfide isomerase/thioredoxin
MSNPAKKGRSGPGRAPLIAVGVAAVIAVVLVVVAVAGKDGDPAKADSSGVAQVHDVTVTGAALPEFDSAVSPDPAVGKKPPELSGQTFDGSAVSFVPGGKAKLAVFVAHWCPHCQAEVPRIVQWMASEAYPKNVDVIAVSTGVVEARGNYPPSAWLAREKFTVPTLTDDLKNTASAAWGLSGYPYLVLLKADGTVAARYSGEFAGVAQLDAWVKAGLGLS